MVLFVPVVAIVKIEDFYKTLSTFYIELYILKCLVALVCFTMNKLGCGVLLGLRM